MTSNTRSCGLDETSVDQRADRFHQPEHDRGHRLPNRATANYRHQHRKRAAVPDGVRWVRDARSIRALVAADLPRGDRGRDLSQRQTRKAGSWAVILDADETVISNLQYQIERAQAGISPTASESWRRMGDAARSDAAAGRGRFPRPCPRARRLHRHRHESAGVRVRRHRAVFQTHTADIRRDAVPPDNRPVGQEPALRCGRRRHDDHRRPAARSGRIRRRQHPRLSRV